MGAGKGDGARAGLGILRLAVPEWCEFRLGSDSTLGRYRPSDRSCLVSCPEFAITTCLSRAITGSGELADPPSSDPPGRSDPTRYSRNFRPRVRQLQLQH